MLEQVHAPRVAGRTVLSCAGFPLQRGRVVAERLGRAHEPVVPGGGLLVAQVPAGREGSGTDVDDLPGRRAGRLVPDDPDDQDGAVLVGRDGTARASWRAADRLDVVGPVDDDALKRPGLLVGGDIIW